MLPILQASGLDVVFPGVPVPTIAVEGVSVSLAPGRVLGVLGESGSGKSQLARALTGLTRGVVTGSVQFGGRDLTGIGEAELNDVRGKHVAYVFQDPMTSLSPYLRISTQMTEVATTHLGLSRHEARKRAREMLERVQIAQAEERLDRYPHELSGGMRQRVMIAMALMADPDVLIADEPTTALDATVQLQVLDLLRDVCDRAGLAVMVITHDISVLARIADTVLVLYAGREAEYGTVAAVLGSPRHPYTSRLIESTPDLERPVGDAIEGIPGTLPGPGVRREQCLFSARCMRAQEICRTVRPLMEPAADGRAFACHFPLGAGEGA